MRSLGVVALANKLKGQPKKIGGSIWRKLSWKAKLLVPLAALASLIYGIELLADSFM